MLAPGNVLTAGITRRTVETMHGDSRNDVEKLNGERRVSERRTVEAGSGRGR